MATLYTDRELRAIVDRLERLTDELPEWEQKFVTGVSALVADRKTLSKNQHECLSQIWDRFGDGPVHQIAG